MAYPNIAQLQNLADKYRGEIASFTFSPERIVSFMIEAAQHGATSVVITQHEPINLTDTRFATKALAELQAAGYTCVFEYYCEAVSPDQQAGQYVGYDALTIYW